MYRLYLSQLKQTAIPSHRERKYQMKLFEKIVKQKIQAGALTDEEIVGIGFDIKLASKENMKKNGFDEKDISWWIENGDSFECRYDKIMFIIKTKSLHDSDLKNALSDRVRAYVSQETWEFLKSTGEEKGCQCSICSGNP
jgi:hypothetical protein